MTITRPTEAGKGAQAVQTNGVGQTTTAHLNLSRSLADVWRAVPAAPVLPTIRTVRTAGPARRPVPFAGYDATEKGWK